MKLVNLIKSAVISSVAFSGLSYADIYICNKTDIDQLNVAFALPSWGKDGPSVYTRGWHLVSPKGACKRIAMLTGRQLFWVGVFGVGTYIDENNQRRARYWTGNRTEFQQITNLCVSTQHSFLYKHEVKDGFVVGKDCPQGAISDRLPFGVSSTPDKKDIYFNFTNEFESSDGLERKITVQTVD